MRGLEQYQELVARNLSASSVPGYQRQETVFESVLAGERASPTAEHPKGPAYLVQARHHTVHEAGRVVRTDAEFDFSIRDGAFFKLQTPEGLPFYTRNGHFQLNGEGLLVNNRGMEVLVDGAPINIERGNGPVVADDNGLLTQQGEEVGQLEIVSFTDPEYLHQTLGGFVESEPGMAGEAPVEDPGLNQGTLESSNVSAIEEMSRLITLSRAYETHQKLIHHQDENMKKALQYLNPAGQGA